jgi:RNA polymerase sigma factor (sigma-70 family)
MIKIEAMQATQENDAELVAESLNGNQDAFRKIVERYQTLICSLAYCATGSVGQSEDLAQETFVAAWKELPELREPSKLRSWLCAILRFRISKQSRRQTREPVHAAESLEAADHRAAPEAAPSDQAISHEEQAILWRSLERIPEMYREPLVLFYREHQSVEAVAEKLGLSRDAVKQRLSRGRKLLQGEVLEFITGALARTNPGQAFTVGVLAALPVTLASSAKAAALAAAAAKGGATATGTGFVSVVLGVLSGPALGFLLGFLGWREQLKVTRTPRERALIKRFGITILACGILFFVGCSLYSGCLAPRLWKAHPVLVLALGWAIVMSWAVFTFAFSWRHNRTMRRLREEERQCRPELFRDELPPEAFEYRSRTTLFGLPLVHWRSWGRMRRPGEKIQPAIGWIACGERAYGILYASGGIAVGAISTGGVSVGLLAFGGLSIGLLAFGGLAIGAVALGGGTIGWIASGGLALGWHAALGGVVAAHELACGGAALGNHVNDALARKFFQAHRWLDFTQAGPRNLFWLLCFGPMFVQMLIWIWWRRRMTKRPIQN